jgi:hypothetical protein
VSDLFARLLDLDERLAATGVPPLSQRWRDELAVFYGAPYKVHAGRIGRGGSKSTTAAKCLVAEVLLGSWTVPPGERHWALNVSENMSEAAARLGQIAYYLTVLGVEHARVGEQVVLKDLPLGFWTRAARIGAVSGPRVVAWAVDEAAKLKDDTGNNPAREIVASLKAASITHPEARGRVYSSPMGPSGYHYDLVEAGTTNTVLVSQGASWDWMPAITEAQTHEVEPDERIWRREYLAIPGEGESAYFRAEDIEAALRADSRHLPVPRYPHIYPDDLHPLACYAAMDLSSAREGRNGTTLAVAWIDRGVMTIGMVHEWRGGIEPTQLFREARAMLVPYRTSTVYVDGFSVDYARVIARGAGINLREWKQSEDREDMFATFLRYARTRKLSLPKDKTVIRDLLSTRFRASPGGEYRIVLARTPDGRHADTVPAMLLAALYATRAAHAPVRNFDRVQVA